MGTTSTYTQQDLEEFRVKFVDFLNKYATSPRWHERAIDNGLPVKGGTLQGWVYNRKGKPSAIYELRGIMPKNFYELMAYYTPEKFNDEIIEEKAELQYLYEKWRKAQRHAKALKKSMKAHYDAEIEAETQPAIQTQPSLTHQPKTLARPSKTKHEGGTKNLVIQNTNDPPKKLTIKHPSVWAAISVVALAITLIFIIFPLDNLSLGNQKSEITENSQWKPQYQMVGDIRMVYVPEGCFTMGYLHGEASEQPVERICSKPFWLAETETTISQYGEIPIESCNIDQLTKEKLVNEPTPDNPMNCITWQEAHDFCTARGMRLPTEAEWEYATRGPSNWLYPWGNVQESTYTIVRIDPNAPRPVPPVGSMSRDTSWVGAKDLAGSLREFTSTIHNISMNTHTPFEMPYNPDDGRESLENIGTWEDWSGTTRVVKGGNFDLPISDARASLRYDEFFDFRFNHYGFRCAMDA